MLNDALWLITVGETPAWVLIILNIFFSYKYHPPGEEILLQAMDN